MVAIENVIRGVELDQSAFGQKQTYVSTQIRTPIFGKDDLSRVLGADLVE